MPILIDFSQILYSGILAYSGTSNDEEESVVDIGIARHIILNKLVSIRRKYKREYGELVLCSDSIRSWRKEFFPHYKASRKTARKGSQKWKEVFVIVAQINSEMKEFFPYRFIEVDGAEADDIIATIIRNTPENEKILIVSGDKDFLQLQVHKNVKQHAPVNIKKHPEFYVEENPTNFLRNHILRGDQGDGVPNFLSPDDCFVANKRQSSISSEKLEKWLKMKPEDFCTTEMMRGYKRNEELIDLTKTPADIVDKILQEYQKEFKADRSKLMKYFGLLKLRNLMDKVSEF